MDYSESLLVDLNEFIDFFIMKYKYENVGIIRKIRAKSGLNTDLSEDKWYEFFISKSAINHSLKVLLIKIFEDKHKVLPKLNTEGFEYWSKMVVDLDNQYNNIYNIALQDILTVTELRKAFKECDYDVYVIDNELASYIIKKLLKYDFDEITVEKVSSIVENLYKEHGELEYFYKPAPVVEFISEIKESKEILI